MTLRIFVEIEGDHATVALHGRLSAAEVAEVERATSVQDKPLRVDLAHLTGVDTDGLRALRRLREGGARLTDASPFVELMLERTEPADAGAPKGGDGLVD